MNHEYIKFYIQLLEMEIEALRSVLSEYDVHHAQYVQWIKAQAIDQLKKNLERP